MSDGIKPWSTDGPTLPDEGHPDFMPMPSTSSVKLIKNTKGYNWEIKIYNENTDEMMNQLLSIEEKLKSVYGEKNA